MARDNNKSGKPAEAAANGKRRARKRGDERDATEAELLIREDVAARWGRERLLILAAIGKIYERKVSKSTGKAPPDRKAQIAIAYETGLNRGTINRIPKDLVGLDIEKLLKLSYVLEFDAVEFLADALHGDVEPQAIAGPNPPVSPPIAESPIIDPERAAEIFKGIADMGPLGDVPTGEWLAMLGVIKALGKRPGAIARHLEGVRVRIEARVAKAKREAEEAEAFEDAAAEMATEGRKPMAEIPVNVLKNPARGELGSLDHDTDSIYFSRAKTPKPGEQSEPSKEG